MSVSHLEVSKRALLQNIQTFRAVISKKTKLLAVVKANAYGHELGLVSKTIENGVDWFGVDNLDEARFLRKHGSRKPILVLGFVPTDRLDEAINLGVSLVVYRTDVLKKMAEVARKAGKKARVHLKVETGTNRQGVAASELPLFAKGFRKHKELLLEGVYTHFANIEDTTDSSFAMEQLKKFNEVLGILKKHGPAPRLVHTAATAAVILYPPTHFDMVRVGIGLYGLWPSTSVRRMVSRKVKLAPVLSWKTEVVQVKDVLKGESVGYGRTWVARSRSRIAVLPVGYSDGYDRRLSNRGRVLTRGKFAPVVGRIAMNMMTVDVTDIPKVGEGDEVILLGKQGKNEVTAEDLADLLGTINYEVVSRLNPNIPRRLIS